MITRRYTFKMYPNATQKAALDHLRVMCCRLYNGLNEQRHDRWNRFGQAMSAYDQGREMTAVRNDPDLPEWHGFPSAICERVAGRVDQAWKKYFHNLKNWRKQGMRFPFPPRYQKTALFDGFGLRENGNGWRFLGKKMKLGKLGMIKLRGKFPYAPEDIRTADLMLKSGTWLISIVVKLEDKRRIPRPQCQNFHPDIVNSLNKLMGLVSITCSDPGFQGGQKVPRRLCLQKATCSDPGFQGGQKGVCPRGQSVRPCSDPGFQGGQKVIHSHEMNEMTCSDPGFQGGQKGAGAHKPEKLPCSDPGFQGGTKGGSDKNRIARLNYAYHYITSVIAAENCDVTITRPPLRAASKSGKGNKYEHGALVDFKAKQTRKLLDLNIGKFCELLAYKVETWGNKLIVIEDTDSPAVLPGEIADLAKLGKKARRIKKRKAA